MVNFRNVFLSWWLAFCLLLTAGCSTFETISHSKQGSPKFFSGTRLNLCALTGNQLAMRKFPVDPPSYPLLDLPASFVLDLYLSPLTGADVLYETVFSLNP